MRSHGVRLLVHSVLLLHEKMDATTKNDALDDSPPRNNYNEQKTLFPKSRAFHNTNLSLGNFHLK
jgi:hypothetical protein